MAPKLLPMPTRKIDDYEVEIGDTICPIRPSLNFRWLVNRQSGEKVLQQQFTATVGVEGFWSQTYEEWRDVPTATDP